MVPADFAEPTAALDIPRVKHRDQTHVPASPPPKIVCTSPHQNLFERISTTICQEFATLGLHAKFTGMLHFRKMSKSDALKRIAKFAKQRSDFHARRMATLPRRNGPHRSRPLYSPSAGTNRCHTEPGRLYRSRFFQLNIRIAAFATFFKPYKIYAFLHRHTHKFTNISAKESNFVQFQQKFATFTRSCSQILADVDKKYSAK